MNRVLCNMAFRVTLLCVFAAGTISAVAIPETKPVEPGYLTSQGEVPVKSGFGLCWRAGSGPVMKFAPECDPNFVPAPAARAVEPAPPPVAAAVVGPEPVLTPVAERVTLDARTLFDFDKAVLRPAGEAALDDFVRKYEPLHPEIIMAVGHADRLGSEAYNQTLSEHRVEAVRNYLITKGIGQEHIHTEGNGETQPVTKSGECVGEQSTKVIECLQPDRRVELEVQGAGAAR
jgi:OOP family OmpA-OmpF porin